ncbi:MULTISPECIES: diguanylate cyclase [Rhizobium]|uniref:diguanylate cyclase n=1 Tax=Rhizobium johnstonii (strain DSM 114642 / LMG 32736 / 3841) TaxID=216596 RepID=Q1M3V7_RHIJ3|nr:MULTISPECIES: diguanylate cyclase [Rhizobium]NEI56917.1 diguanylate cyclase [Rhizobium leguminosarum]NEI85765.1 diguanylate cyclase [Rhizobium leguminosarum]NEI93768.1 diguanylate cyclase [Rhizobium leguminosarum]NEJ80059.1 diguanylate cyclase [Rhizobium leguminosarum]CAK12217.1 putative response regulator/GGDEF domain transcriptional regulator [Rhizobium johnstonii 3841]
MIGSVHVLEGGSNAVNGIWTQFGGNLSFVCLAISLWAHFSIQFQSRSVTQEKIAFGIIAGGASIGSILLAVEVNPGIYIDIRFSPLALAGMFGGPIAAAFAASLAMVFRFAVGGTAMIDGLIAIAVATGIGLAANVWIRRRSAELMDVALLSLALGVALIVLMAVLPTLVHARVLAIIGLPMTVLNCLATALCGFVLLKTQQWELERSILVTAFSQSPDYLYVKDRNSRFITVNENMSRLFRFRTTAEMTGLSDFNLISRPRAEEFYYLEQQVMDTGVPLIDSVERIEDRYLLASKVPLKDRQGRVIGLAGVTRDVTERTALERELRKSKNLLSHAMAGMSDGIAMYDSKGFLVFCNDQYRTAFPLSGDARVVGAHISDILRRVAETGERTGIPDNDREEWIKAASATLHSNKDEEVQLHNGDWRSIRTRLAEDGTAMAVVSDITATKQAEIALRLSAEQLRNLAETDGLTGIVNRRAFDEAFARETAGSARKNTPFSLLMVDIDRFKAYNDTYGHPAGDQCLRVVSKCLRQSVSRPADIVARYGGEEFVVLLPATSAKGAMIVAEQFARLLSQENIVHTGSEFGRVTASIGISCATGATLRLNPNRLLIEADAALYDAKTQGRNRILAHSPEERHSMKDVG